MQKCKNANAKTIKNSKFRKFNVVSEKFLINQEIYHSLFKEDTLQLSPVFLLHSLKF